jgi:hypothetical protein
VFLAKYGCITLPEFSGQTLAGSNKGRQSREGHGKQGRPKQVRVRQAPISVGTFNGGVLPERNEKPLDGVIGGVLV